MIQGCGDALQRIDKRPVEVENQSRFHAGKLAGAADLGKPLEPDQTDQFGVTEVVELIHRGEQRFCFRDVLDGDGLW